MSLVMVLFLLLFHFLSITYHQSADAYVHHIQVKESGILNEKYQNYADSIATDVPANEPVVIFVPLNGVPTSEHHPSYRSSKVALEILKRLPNHKKYLLLSEGYDMTTCSSGSELVAGMLYMHEGYNENNDVYVLLEREARTTLQNVILSEQIIGYTFADAPVHVIIAGITDVKRTPFGLIDIGHGARAYVLAKQRSLWSSSITLQGIIPTNTIDYYIGGYPTRYNAITMVLATTRALYLPFFDRSEIVAEGADCILHR